MVYGTGPHVLFSCLVVWLLCLCVGSVVSSIVVAPRERRGGNLPPCLLSLCVFVFEPRHEKICLRGLRPE